MLIQLPNETWIEILDWLKRRDMLNKLDQLWDRQFTPIVQDWLHNHKYTKNVKIGRLAAAVDGGLHLQLDGVWTEVPIAQVELPENIVSFKDILISRHPLEPAMLVLLQQMRPLFRNICLEIYSGYGVGNEWPIQNCQETTRMFMPLISDDQIESIILDYQWLQFLTGNFRDALFNARLLSTQDYKPDHSELLTDWLFTRRKDGQPRTLVFCDNVKNDDQSQFFEDFSTKVRERFLDPTRQLASPFFVRWFDYWGRFATTSKSENARTGELLTVQKVEHDDYWLITSCPLRNVDPELLAKKTAEVCKWNDNQQRKICLDFAGLKMWRLGRLTAAAAGE